MAKHKIDALPSIFPLTINVTELMSNYSLIDQIRFLSFYEYKCICWISVRFRCFKAI